MGLSVGGCRGRGGGGPPMQMHRERRSNEWEQLENNCSYVPRVLLHLDAICSWSLGEGC